jgi:30S ribosomal protein S31
MGRGDRRTVKGKTFVGSFGNIRPARTKAADKTVTTETAPAKAKKAPAKKAATKKKADKE